MVEGPGCKVKGEKLKPRIRGQTVKGVAGNAVEKVCNETTALADLHVDLESSKAGFAYHS